MKRTVILSLCLLASATVLIAAAAKAPEEITQRNEATSNDAAPLDVFSVASAGSTLVNPALEPVPVPSTCICPQDPYAKFEDHWSYYATKCEDCSAGTLDAEPNLPFTNCPGCGDTPPGDCPGDCVLATSIVFSTVNATQRSASHLGAGHYVLNVRKNGRAGIGKTGFKTKRSRKYQIRLNKKIAAKQAEFVVKIVRKSGQPFLAKLVLVSIDPQRISNLPKRFSRLPVRTEGIGFEIDEPGTTPVESGNVVTEEAGDVVPVAEHPHCYLVRYRHVWYRVLCHAGHVR